MLHKVVNFEDEALCGNAFVLKLVNFKDEALCGDAFVLKVDKFVREYVRGEHARVKHVRGGRYAVRSRKKSAMSRRSARQPSSSSMPASVVFARAMRSSATPCA